MSVIYINPFAVPGDGTTWSGGIWLSGGGTVTLSGESVTGPSCSIQIRSDGYVYANGGAVDTGTDWVLPRTEAPGLYEVYCTIASGDGLDTGASDAVDTWLALTSTRTWTWVEGIGVAPGIGLTISIREGSGATLDSASYSMAAL